MDWQAEADALMNDIKNYVGAIRISNDHKSNDYRIYFEIETLEGVALLVSMDVTGFAICDKDTGLPTTRRTGGNDGPLGSPVKVYETINSLLDDNSPMYREAFAGDLQHKIGLLKENDET